MPMPRRRLAAVLAVTGLAAVAAVGGEAPAAGSGLPGEQVTLETSAATLVPCQDGLAPGRAGAAIRPYLAIRDEALTVRTASEAGTDYDVAIYDRATGRTLGSAASFTSDERVTVLLERGQGVDIQACRRSGDAASVRLGLESFALPAQALAPGTPPQLVEVALPAGARDAERLNDLGLDVTHSVDDDSAQVILYSAAERARLDAARFAVTVLEPDLPASLRRVTLADERRAADPQGRALPSGRTTYREFGDYGTDLKAIADQFPGHVKATTLAGTSLEGRPFEGVEIAADVGKPDDGRPIFLLTGLTHAREWPGGEMAIEFAIDLAKTFDAKSDPRVTKLLEKVRVFVFPMANPDGFAVSRQAGAAMAAGDDSPQEATLPMALTDSGAYKRKNCRAATPAEQSSPCASRVGFGVDLNRAYSAFWGGAGSSDNMATQQYRGPEPFTEPEALAIRAFGQAHQTQVYITNHTFTEEGRILRQPGFDIPNDVVDPVTPDEPRMKALGDAMAESTQGISELGYATLGNITGPADDFLYYSQGTYGYTPELRGGNFHTGYANAVVREYEGFDATAGRGWREAYIVAGEFAGDPADHVVLEGTAPADATLRLRKDFTLPRSTDTDGDGTDDIDLVTTPEKIDTTIAVGSDAAYEWHVNPSKRPYGPADEAFTLTCERGGTVRATRTFTAARGEKKTFTFSDCGSLTPGPAATATSTPTATRTPTPTATPGPGAGARLRVAIRRPAFSARRANKRRAVRARIVLRGAGSLTGVTVRVRRAGRTVLRGTAKTLARSRKVRLRRTRKLSPGRYRIVLTARTDTGAAVRVTKRLRVRR